MNRILLIGHLSAAPVYFCTAEGRDLTRFQLHVDPTEERPALIHHCQAWGPAALDLHEHLTEGERVLVRGELRYRERSLEGIGTVQVPYVYVRGYSYLG